MICYLAMLDSEEDKDKFTLLYERYSQPMFYIAKQILKDVQGAEDCVHDAFLKILQNMDKVGKAEDARTRSFVFITEVSIIFRYECVFGGVGVGKYSNPVIKIK